MIGNCDVPSKSLLDPLLHHCNTTLVDVDEDPTIIRFLERRILCPASFRFIDSEIFYST